jgi:hypothetical protein
VKCGPRSAKFGVAEDNEHTYVLCIKHFYKVESF